MSTPTLLDRADRAILAVTRWVAWLGALAVAGIFVLVFSSVVMRYLFQAPFRFTDELAGLLLGTAIFLCLPYMIASHEAIRVTLISDRLPGWGRRIAHWLAQAILLAFGIVFAWEAWDVIAFTLRLNLMTEQARLPLGPFLILMTVAFAMVAALGAWRLFRPPPEPGTGSGRMDP